MSNLRWPETRAVIALILIAGFMAAYFQDQAPNDIMRGALIGAFAGAWGYYLGSSKGSTDKNAALAAKPPTAPVPESPGDA